MSTCLERGTPIIVLRAKCHRRHFSSTAIHTTFDMENGDEVANTGMQRRHCHLERKR
jgi:hypothetical protein